MSLAKGTVVFYESEFNYTDVLRILSATFKFPVSWITFDSFYTTNQAIFGFEYTGDDIRRADNT